MYCLRQVVAETANRRLMLQLKLGCSCCCCADLHNGRQCSSPRLHRCASNTAITSPNRSDCTEFFGKVAIQVTGCIFGRRVDQARGSVRTRTAIDRVSQLRRYSLRSTGDCCCVSISNLLFAASIFIVPSRSMPFVQR